MIPVKLSVKHWELGPSPADIGFSIGVKPVSLEEALDERRLSLTLDSKVGRTRPVYRAPLGGGCTIC